MKNLFPEYSGPSEEEVKRTWSNGLFVFDTNVLLNLYRYRAEARDELLNVLTKLTPRIWIPFHVALEFQRNRLKVIAAQYNLFAKVRQTVEKSRDDLANKLEELQIKDRHALIDPEPLTTGFSELTKTFLTQLEKLREQQQLATGQDPLLVRIETLFEGRVGTPPADQKELDEIYKRAEIRFKSRIPPGYEDNEKDKEGFDEHLHGGKIYKRKFGDYLIWDQILDHAKQANIKAVIFITDDRKEDWWLKINSDGPKTIGPRPELIDEARLRGSVDTFLMYRPESFLQFSKEHLKAKVSEKTLKEVRDVSIARLLANTVPQVDPAQAENAVQKWLSSQFETVELTKNFPDFLASRNGATYGFEVKTVRHPANAHRRLQEAVNGHVEAVRGNELKEMSFVIVTGSKLAATRITKELTSETNQEARFILSGNVKVVVGTLIKSETGTAKFEPVSEFQY